MDLDEKAAYICQLPQKDIGCLNDGNNGADYNGTASKSASGEECLRWNTIHQNHQIHPNQTQWAHNYCRNPGGEDLTPICFVNLEEYDSCAIPKCQNRPVRPGIF